MSLDVYLNVTSPVVRRAESLIYVREDGRTVGITAEEWNRRNPDRQVEASWEEVETTEVYSANITHNLNRMADAAGIYQPLWRPEEIGVTKAAQLVPLLRAGLEKLRADPEHFRQFNAANGWGLYENFVPFVAAYLAACEEYPDADVSVSR